MSTHTGRACVCCARVGDPHWREQGEEHIAKRCSRCGEMIVVEVATLEAVAFAFGAEWDPVCVECYRRRRSPVEVWL